jgi:hypothetical protein
VDNVSIYACFDNLHTPQRLIVIRASKGTMTFSMEGLRIVLVIDRKSCLLIDYCC